MAVATNILMNGLSKAKLILNPKHLDFLYKSIAIIQLDAVVLITGARYPKNFIREKAIITLVNMAITAILNGVVVSPFEKKIGVKIL